MPPTYRRDDLSVDQPKILEYCPPRVREPLDANHACHLLAAPAEVG
jgi:hypothetical protein